MSTCGEVVPKEGVAVCEYTFICIHTFIYIYIYTRYIYTYTHTYSTPKDPTPLVKLL